MIEVQEETAGRGGMWTRMRNNIDWVMVLAIAPLLAFGLLTMHSFTGDDIFFERQVIWVVVSILMFLIASVIDWRFLRRTPAVVVLYSLSVVTLLLLFAVGTVTKGAISRFDFGFFFLQPSDPVKLVLIVLLAKYFSRRHVAIANVRHLIVSGFYAFVLFVLVFLQPDFGSAIILFLIWLGMVLVSGISKKHLITVFFLGVIVFGLLWAFAFQDYQKQRIMTFLNPLTDLQGAGYNAYQSTIAIGSGKLLGKGFGYGTQSRLEFLPEYETDFIFAAFAEEWGFLGVSILFILFGVVLWRILKTSMLGATNFEVFFGLGIAVLFIAHFVIHVGINIGVLPVTGTTMPFLSYGGSHLGMELLGLGMLMGMRGYGRSVERHKAHREFVGPQ